MNKIFLHVCVLGLLCMSACDQRETSLSSESVASGIKYDTITKSNDWKIITEKSASTVAARVIPISDSIAGWPDGTVISVSVFTATPLDPIDNRPTTAPPSMLYGIIDTATKSWISLINPDANQYTGLRRSVVFRRVDDNDASAQVKIYYTDSSYSLDQSVLAATNDFRTLSYDLAGARITIFGNRTSSQSWTTNRIYLYHVVLHELGHVMGVGHDSDNVDDVMNSTYDFSQANSDPTYQRFFTTNATETINKLYNGAISSYYVPFFIRRLSGRWDNANPIIGWDSAKARMKLGQNIALKGIVGRPGYRALSGIYKLTNSSGNANYWNSSNVSSYNSYQVSHGCADRAITAGVPIFRALAFDTTLSSILETATFNGVFQPEGGDLLWNNGFYPSNSCQRGLGAYYNLEAAN